MKTNKKRLVILVVVLIGIAALYFVSYLFFRLNHVEVWQKNGRPYVIFPMNAKALYCFYRPLTYLDARCTGIGIHIGPHMETR